ncbi:MAG TPA: tRNA (guanosine(46)-N7)-methyltransferase TrmB [Candidatus Onthousia faecipullorum]|uniref:tRNA (guanine-N(7)-)-methyltransferase n=1 Tax=Candidatus Onthousia faecipullorum TaxID=2840887 RepID=A0A9D1KAZ3_9FIRM|nr:tRNA (guanosine(46)-N7)-methyltransferase TrmB [Candidatus Onthousia faecipullorum]
MRLRNVKDKEEILNNCKYLIKNPEEFKGKWKSLFNNDNPIYIEIGMGKGKFILENALKYPNINYIGIERFDSVMAKAIKKIPDSIENLKLIRMNALDIDKVFSKEIDLIYLNFSDPWPKKRWHDRRLTSKIFLDKYDLLFKDTKRIEMKTDNENLFIYSLETLSSKGYALSDISFDYHKTDTDIIMSEYEMRFSKEGKNVYHLFAQKK